VRLADDLALLDSDGVCTALGSSPYTIPAGIGPPKMPAVVHQPAIPDKETLTPAQATVKIPISKAENTVDIKMDILMKVF